MIADVLRRPALAFLGVLVVSACGNDPEREGTFALLQSSIATVAGPLGGEDKSGAQATANPQEIAAILPQLPPGPVVRFEVTQAEQSAIAYQIATNGPYRTLSTITGQTLTMRAGLVTATRGFSWDLMSSATNGAIDMIRGRRSGNVQRLYRHLDYSNDEVEFVADCRISRDGNETVRSASGRSHATTRMRERCRGGEIQFDNLYWVSSGGSIVQSSQWVSEEIGALQIDLLRN